MRYTFLILPVLLGAGSHRVDPPARWTRACIVSIAEQHVGIHEATDHNDGPEVEAILARVGLPKGNSWCGAFVHRVYELCGDTLLPARSYAWVPSWFPRQRVIWNGKDKTAPILPGDVVGFYSRNLGRLAHVGIAVQETMATVVTIEGNTNAEGAREGNGVWKKKRLKGQISAVADWITK